MFFFNNEKFFIKFYNKSQKVSKKNYFSQISKRGFQKQSLFKSLEFS